MASNDSEKERKVVGLPPIIFMFTLDQLSAMLGVDEKMLKANYLYYAHRSVGIQRADDMYAVNVAPPEMPAEWRVSQKEFVRWCKKKGFRAYDVSRSF